INLEIKIEAIMVNDNNVTTSGMTVGKFWLDEERNNKIKSMAGVMPLKKIVRIFVLIDTNLPTFGDSKLLVLEYATSAAPTRTNAMAVCIAIPELTPGIMKYIEDVFTA